MDGNVDREMTAVALHAIRPEKLDVLRRGGFHHEDGRERQNYQQAFDRVISRFGVSAEMAIVSWLIASNVAELIGDHDPVGWRWGDKTYYHDPFLEKAVREFEGLESLFFGLVRKFSPVAKQMRECLPVYDEELDELVTALQPFARPRTRAADPRSEWHATAKLFAGQIEAHFRALRLEPPTRNSACSPLVLAVQSLLGMVGLRVEAETIRKVLWQTGDNERPSRVARGGRHQAP